MLALLFWLFDDGIKPGTELLCDTSESPQRHLGMVLHIDRLLKRQIRFERVALARVALKEASDYVLHDTCSAFQIAFVAHACTLRR